MKSSYKLTKLNQFMKSKSLVKTTSLSILLILFVSTLAQSQDKSFERKQVTDTKKKLDINKKDIADPHKKLKIREGDLTDTKKLLRKTDSLSNTQLATLKRNVIKSVGNEAYSYAYNRSPNLIKMRLKYDWLKMQVQQDYSYWKGREQREKSGKKNNKSNSGLSATRAKDYKKRYSEYDKKIANYNTQITRLDKMIIDMKKGGGAAATDFIKNTAGESGARLTDKFGNFLANLKKGEEVETKNSKLDERYYEVKYKNKIYFSLKEYFSK